MRGVVRNLLACMLEESSLVARVRELDPRTLGHMIRHVGLEDAGEIVALATTDQLREIFDEDLWVSEGPGRQERFDGHRFGLWLEILLESGEELVVDKLLELPEEIVTLGFQRQILVLDMDALGEEMAGRHRDVDLVEKALESCLCEEIDAYRIVARCQERWDAVITVLLALDQNHHGYLQRLLERCCDASTEYIEDNGGLYEVLTAEEMIEGDAAAEREDRRAAAGFVAPSDAVSFLGLPRVGSFEDALSAEGERDPVTRAYFRSLDVASRGMRAPLEGQGVEPERFARLLKGAGVIEATTPALPAKSKSNALPFSRAIASSKKRNPQLYGQRMEELAYMTNVLIVGSSFAGRSFRPVEAAEAVIATCNLGLACRLDRTKDTASGVVRRYGADSLFRVGWHFLFDKVSMGSARCILKMIDKRGGIVPVSMRTALADRKPWLLRPQIRHVGVLSEEEQRLFKHLIDRHPSLPPADDGPTPRFFATLEDVELASRLAGSQMQEEVR